MENSKTGFDINQYVGILIRRKWFFIWPMLIVFSGFVTASFVMPKVYRAEAKILVEDQKVVNPLLKDIAVSTPVTARLNTLREEILAWPRLFELVEKLKLNKDIKSPLDLERLIAKIKRNISLDMNMKSGDLLVISYHSKNPLDTQTLVNTLCDILINRNVSIQKEDTGSAIDFIQQQLAIYKEKLDTAESNLRQFKEVYDVTPAAPGSDDSSVTGTALKNINKELSDLEAALVLASVDNTELHPRVQAIKTRIEALKETRDKYVKELAEKAGVDPKSYVGIADSSPRQQEELARLTRDKAINEQMYAMLLQKLESAEITERLDNSENRTKFRIVEPARLPLTYIKPNKIQLTLMGVLFGIMAGVGMVYLLEYMDTSFKSEEQLEQAFGYPVLGNISKIVIQEDQPASPLSGQGKPVGV